MKLAQLICLFVWIEIMLETLQTGCVVGFWFGSPPTLSFCVC